MTYGTSRPKQQILSHSHSTTYPGQLSLVIPPWVGEMTTVIVTAIAREENGEFCVTAGLLAGLKSVKGAGC